jgi:hypothetical protein
MKSIKGQNRLRNEKGANADFPSLKSMPTRKQDCPQKNAFTVL